MNAFQNPEHRNALNPKAEQAQGAMKSRFITAAEIMRDANVGKTTAYNCIRTLNEQLRKKGMFTFTGKVLRRYYYDSTGGM